MSLKVKPNCRMCSIVVVDGKAKTYAKYSFQPSVTRDVYEEPGQDLPAETVEWLRGTPAVELKKLLLQA